MTAFRTVTMVTFLATCAAVCAAAQDSLPLVTLRAAIERRIAQVPGADVAVSYRDLEQNARLDIGADVVFHAASTMKIPVMIEVLRAAESGRLSLDQQVLLVNRFHSIVDGSPYSLSASDDSDSLVYAMVGTRVAVRELVEGMIVRSSNLATNELIALVGAEQVNATAHALGATHIRVLRGVEDGKAFDAGMNNTTTSADLATLLLRIETGDALDVTGSKLMKTILLHQEFNEGIPAGLPAGTPVAHKTGSITATWHDAAIVYPPAHAPYVLVVLTRKIPDASAGHALIADISRLVWTYSVNRPRQ